MIQALFAAIDGKSASAFAEHLADDCIFRFANQEPVKGKPQVEQFVAAFFDSIEKIEHNVEAVWRTDDIVGCHGHVRYTRLSGSTLTVPFANVFKMAGPKIREYLIFVDASQLYAE